MLKKLFQKFAGNAERERFEASMNFDMEDVPEFATIMNKKFGPGLRSEVLVEFTRSVAVEDEQTLVLNAGIKGAEKQLEMVVHMDDIDAPDIYFFSSSRDLIDAINVEMIKFAESKGM